MRRLHRESHLVSRIGWLRAAVLGANDGIISTASLILGVASAAASKSNVLLSGVAGLVAGAMSMAAGEYVSVSSQADTEHADLEREKHELSEDPKSEKEELAQIYIARGVKPGLARQVAQQLMAKDAWVRMLATSLEFPRSAQRAQFRPHWRQPPHFRSERRARSFSLFSRHRPGCFRSFPLGRWPF